MEGHGRDEYLSAYYASGIVSTALITLSYNVDRTEVQPALIIYTESRLASPQSLLHDLQCGHENGSLEWPWCHESTPQGTGCLGLRGGSGTSHEEPENGSPSRAAMHPLWLLKNTEVSTKHREGAFDYLVERLTTPHSSKPPLPLLFLFISGVVFLSC